jgi:mono/diheme cytochrome c family protein
MKLTRYLIPALVMVLGACATQRLDTRPIGQLSGVELYERLCASCHGVQAKGDGPVAPLIMVRVADLTRLALRDGGEFPTEDVRRVIDGRFERGAHGSREMPVWGWQLYNSESPKDEAERARVDAMLGRLVEYLRSVQVTE